MIDRGHRSLKSESGVLGKSCVIRNLKFGFPASMLRFFLFCILLFPSISSSEDLIEVKGLRHWSTPEYTRVVVDLSASAEFAKGRLSNPERLFFDVKDSKLAKGLSPSLAVNDKLLKTVRLGQFNANTVRIVFDLEVSDCDFKIFSLEDPPRLVIDIFSKGAADGKKTDVKNIDARKPDNKAPENKPPDIKRPEEMTEAGLMQRRIIIDPGHGGHDPGAVGPTGLYEKDVVLDIALKVRDIIRREYPSSYQVILTRDTDVFIPLPKRAEIANNNNADLFLSIHANASPNRRARGIETYLLNWTDDEEALRVAARENAISIRRMKQVQDELGVILASLERESKRDGSVKLAGYIQTSLVSSLKPQYPQINDLKVKQALFYVLVDAKMASALAEVSFISNPDEERLLASDSYRQEIAYSLVSGINSYFTSAPSQKMVSYASGQEPVPDVPQKETSYKKVSQSKKKSGIKKHKTKTVKHARKHR